MRCTNCGAEIPEGQWVCPNCFAKVQIVPDYNPLDDVLAREVKGSVEHATRPIASQDVRRYNSWGARENDYATRVLNQGERGSSTRVLSQGEMSRIRSQYNRPVRRNAENNRQPYRENEYARQESGYASRTSGNIRPNSMHVRRDANARREYIRQESEKFRQNAGYTYREPGNFHQESGYPIRTSGDFRQNTGYASQNEEDMGRRTDGMRQNTGNVQRTAGNFRQNPNNPNNRRGDARDNQQNTDGRRPQQAMRKKRASKKRMQKMMSVFCIILAVCAVLGFVFYQISYAGVVGKGHRALQSGEYSSAERYFNRALEKDVKKAGAYTGLSKVYIQQKNLEKAEEVFITAIDSQPENADLYAAAIQFYVDTEQLEKISPLLDGCDSSVLSRVEEYVSEAPAFSLDEGTYPEVQEIALSSDGEIRYTEDESTPTSSSTLYKEPILVDEGKTVIKAVSINKKGIPSLVATRTYTVELPIADAPAVTPSTGRYSTPTQITIQVPEGYTAYYTTDGSTPSAASTLYAGPLDMPEGSMIFSAVLISESGKMTSVTKRNYVLQYE
ncbi:MAG: tetratricopeptide repeat protein [Ruminococcus sp.]|jgi:tetratricopeptide (TPR) repeat protein|nr:tetratricopeptide repeat protein [Ruminococcus sp.]